MRRQLITYIGNKRALLGPIGEAVEAVKKRLNKTKLRAFDAFSGSGVVSRFLKAHASHLASNDIEDYATVISRCHLRNRSTVDLAALSQIVADLNACVEHEPLPKGFIEELYAPQDEQAITPDDRVFYTTANARRLDNHCRTIGKVPDDGVAKMLLASLLHKASVHANNAGVLAMLGRLGAVRTFETRYNTYRGSRNLRNRTIHVVETVVSCGEALARGQMARAGGRVGDPWWGVTPFRAWRVASAPR